MIDIVTYRWHEPWIVNYYGGSQEAVLYTEEHVDMIHHQIRKNMILPCSIHHYSKDGSDKVGSDVVSHDFEDDFGGWWTLFSLMRRPDPFLFIGIDNVILKDLSILVEYAYGKGTHTCQSPKKGTSYSGVVWVEDGPSHYERFLEFWNDDKYDKNEWHDELYIEEFSGFKRFPYEWLRSYTRQYLRGIDCSDAVVMAFAGRPKYWEVDDEWVRDATR